MRERAREWPSLLLDLETEGLGEQEERKKNIVVAGSRTVKSSQLFVPKKKVFFFLCKKNILFLVMKCDQVSFPWCLSSRQQVCEFCSRFPLKKNLISVEMLPHTESYFFFLERQKGKQASNRKLKYGGKNSKTSAKFCNINCFFFTFYKVERQVVLW